jgi:hypothetical protein
MKVKRANFPDQSLLFSKTKYHFADSFQGAFVHKGRLNSADIAKAFFSSAPAWVDKLMHFRNKIVGIFGLKTPRSANRKQTIDNFKCEKGEQVGLFKVFDKSDKEVVLGENDKHLDFRVSLFLEDVQNDAFEKKLTISTTVTFKNWFGRFYFFPVRPFHKLIVPTMLKEIIKQLNAGDE